jgi:quinol monooxygenase YgiN
MSEAGTLHVVARFIARPDSVDALKALLVGMLAPTREEEGCLMYELLQCQTDPTDFTFVEEWTDAAALARHAAAPHIAGVQDQVRALVATPSSVRTYGLVED